MAIHTMASTAALRVSRVTARRHVAPPPHRRKVHGIVQNAPRNAAARCAFD